MSEQAEQVKVDYVSMADDKLIEACGDDGMAWAKAFCQLKDKNCWSLNDIDTGLMAGWFANAIEAAWNKRKPKQP